MSEAELEVRADAVDPEDEPDDASPVDAPAEPEPAADDIDLAALPGGERAALEAVLMVIDEPVTETELATALRLPVDRVSALLAELRADYDGYDVATGTSGTPRGFELREVAGGWRIYSRSDFASVVSRFVLEGQTARLTQAALETLAVVAYRQPVSRARVSAIRGVNVDSVVRTLTVRGMIEEAGNDPESGAILYRTTSHFLERMGLDSIDELPQIAPHLPGLDALDGDEDQY